MVSNRLVGCTDGVMGGCGLMSSGGLGGVAVYRDMKLDMLADGSDHGTRETRELVKSTSIFTAFAPSKQY